MNQSAASNDQKESCFNTIKHLKLKYPLNIASAYKHQFDLIRLQINLKT